jgi:hypothetical protein
MTEPTIPTFWTLLIGVDCYMDRTISGLPIYGNLRGCVNDISLMDEFLRQRTVSRHILAGQMAAVSGHLSGECLIRHWRRHVA